MDTVQKASSKYVTVGTQVSTCVVTVVAAVFAQINVAGSRRKKTLLVPLIIWGRDLGVFHLPHVYSHNR